MTMRLDTVIMGHKRSKKKRRVKQGVFYRI